MGFYFLLDLRLTSWSGTKPNSVKVFKILRLPKSWAYRKSYNYFSWKGPYIAIGKSRLLMKYCYTHKPLSVHTAQAFFWKHLKINMEKDDWTMSREWKTLEYSVQNVMSLSQASSQRSERYVERRRKDSKSQRQRWLNRKNCLFDETGPIHLRICQDWQREQDLYRFKPSIEKGN